MVSSSPLVSQSSVSPRKLILAGVILAIVILTAVIGHTIASRNSISIGDCVVTSPSLTSDWDVKKVACSSTPGIDQQVQKVVAVQNDSNGQCELGLTTFQDDPDGKTYCLSSYTWGN